MPHDTRPTKRSTELQTEPPIELPTQLRLAAIISLLSSFALRGASASKAEALCLHLEAAAFGGEPIDPHLRTALEDALVEWLSRTTCDPESVARDFCTLPVANQVFH